MSLILAQHADFMFNAIRENIEGLTEDELKWRPVKESNTIHNILNHTVRIAYILIPQVIEDNVNPEGWDDDYEDKLHSYEKLLDDFGKAQSIVVEGIKGMSEEDLESELELWGRVMIRKHLIFHLLKEIIHHNGQIAMLKGIYKRRNN
jgi:uncharacterized damage-inducible protein DinB